MAKAGSKSKEKRVTKGGVTEKRRELKGAPVRFGMANTAIFAAGLLFIIVGYVLMSRGSMTLAPFLLVGGYCVLVPIALVYRRRGSETQDTTSEVSVTSPGATLVPGENEGE